jgi:hypothetical protein
MCGKSRQACAQRDVSLTFAQQNSSVLGIRQHEMAFSLEQAAASGLKAAPRHAPTLKRRRQWKGNLPTIFEVESEGLLASLSSPWTLANDAAQCKIVLSQLKSAASDERSVILNWLAPAAQTLALSDCSSQVLEYAFKIASGSDRRMLVSYFHGLVYELCMSETGHLVLATLVQTMPVPAIGFVASELEGKGAEVARNCHGYRVVEALIMHCTEKQISKLAHELAESALELSQDTHGHYVLCHLLEHGTTACQVKIIQRLMPEMLSLAVHSTASRVIETAIDQCDFTIQAAISAALLRPEASIVLIDIALCRFGSAILTTIAGSGVCNEYFQVRLKGHMHVLVQSKFGRRVMDSFGLKVPPDVDSSGAKATSPSAQVQLSFCQQRLDGGEES